MHLKVSLNDHSSDLFKSIAKMHIEIMKEANIRDQIYGRKKTIETTRDFQGRHLPVRP